MARTVLKTEKLKKVYSLGGIIQRTRINALDNVNLNFESDNPIIISLVGESGSGKTTLAKVILRLIEPTAGQAVVYDRLVAGAGEKENRQEFMTSIQPIFQNPFEAFSRYRTVDSYLQMTAKRVNKLTTSDANDAVRSALTSVGLKHEDVAGKYPNQFSGGELQRISVARALIPQPKIIVADEPVSMIDASLRMNIVNLFLSLKEQYHTSFLYITHDLATAYYLSDYIAVMYRGSLVEVGEARAVLKNPKHPYTTLLLESIPSTKQRWPAAQIALSDIETKEYQLEGCKFRNRCPLAQEICAQKRPQPIKKEDGREVYCHFA
jgi:peptide/nickel transport system ATP-binding protein